MQCQSKIASIQSKGALGLISSEAIHMMKTSNEITAGKHHHIDYSSFVFH